MVRRVGVPTKSYRVNLFHLQVLCYSVVLQTKRPYQSVAGAPLENRHKSQAPHRASASAFTKVHDPHRQVLFELLEAVVAFELLEGVAFELFKLLERAGGSGVSSSLSSSTMTSGGGEVVFCFRFPDSTRGDGGVGFFL